MTAVAPISVEELQALLPLLTDDERAEMDRLLAGPSALTFREFVDAVSPRFVWYPHCVRLAAVLQRVADDELHRVIIAEPPRHGKSELVSRLFPAYYLYRHPDRWAAIASYAAELAYTLSRSARMHYERMCGQLASNTGAVKHWETGRGGGMWASGVGGPATGKGFHLGIIDDPVKNHEEAASEKIGQRNRDWYGATWYTRAEPNAAMIVVQTRWPGPGDLVGYLFELEQEEDEHSERWHVVVMEAEKEADPPPIPPSCTLEPDPRAVGEPLCPERYPLERLKRIAKKIGDFFYSALFQQRPRPREGRMFPSELVKIIPEAPAGLRWVRYWDKAGTEGGGAASASVRMAITPEGLVIISDSVNKHLGSNARNELMRTTAQLDGVETEIWIEQEPGSGGKESAEYSMKLLMGYWVNIEPVTGEKVTRARPFAAQWQSGNVRLVQGPWNRRYLERMEASPDAKLKDDMDASSGAFNKLALGYESAGGALVPL